MEDMYDEGIYDIQDDTELNRIILGKIDTLVLRAMLINATPQENIERINTEEEFLVLLDAIENTLEYDKEFFFLRDFIDKTQYMIRLGSNKFSTKGELRKRENENIIALNRLSMTDGKKDIANIFLDAEYEMREYMPYTEELLYVSMANDYYILSAMENKLFDSSYRLPSETKQFLESVSYFTHFIPELYESNSGYVEMVEEYIKKIPIISFKKPHLNKYARKVKKKIELFK